MSDEERRTGGGHEVDHSVGNARKVRAANKKATPTKGYNLAIWVFVALLLATIIIVAVGPLSG